ncbi:MAG TPA: HAD family hydrolase, partial [Candidatus Binataceae bacterium]|nr:HAD family hydrolase [Candidatus Binataceae bacterium]
MTSRAKPAPSPKEIKALLFDFGGTLAFLDYEFLASEFSRPDRRIDPLALEHAEYSGRRAIDDYLMSGKPASALGSYVDYFRTWMRTVGFRDQEIDQLRARFQKIHRASTLWRVVRPGIRETLARLKDAGLKLAVVSNAEGQVEGDAQRFGLAQFFDVIIDSHVVGVAKPDPRIFQIALERLGVGAEESLFAGDIYSID